MQLVTAVQKLATLQCFEFEFVFFLSFLAGGSYGGFYVLYYYVYTTCFQYMGSPYKRSISSLRTTRHAIK